MTNTPPPKAFICHASDDKEGFVRQFARRLREEGVDVWLDEWEMQPGDRLVRKIEQGLDACDIFVVVLSNASITKPWVREELDAGLIKSIEDRTRLIPVLIEECEVPRLLRSRVWVRIKEPSSFESELGSILDTIFGREHRTRPSLGVAPEYTRVPVVAISGITETDSLLLKCVYERFIELARTELTPEQIFEHPDLATVSPEMLLESLEVLEPAYLRLDRSLAQGLDGIELVRSELFGFEQYATAYISNYIDLKYQVVGCLVNTDARDSESIATTLDISPILVAHVLEVLERIKGCVVLSEELSSVRYVISVKPKLKRILAQRLFGG